MVGGTPHSKDACAGSRRHAESKHPFRAEHTKIALLLGPRGDFGAIFRLRRWAWGVERNCFNDLLVGGHEAGPKLRVSWDGYMQIRGMRIFAMCLFKNWELAVG